MTKVGIRWADGTVETAPTWDELESRVRKNQFDIVDPETFRAEMGIRAIQWSGVEIDTDGDASDFFWELERAALLERLPEGTKNFEPGPARKVPVHIYKTGGNDKVPYYTEK